MLKELLAAEQLEIRVLDPAFAQPLVREVVHVFEDRQPRHQPRRQGRTACFVRVGRAERRLQKRPIHRRRQFHQRMAPVDDLIQPGAKQVLLPAVLTSSARDEAPVGTITDDASANCGWTLLHVPFVHAPGFKGPTGTPVGLLLVSPRYTDSRLLNVAKRRRSAR